MIDLNVLLRLQNFCRCLVPSQEGPTVIGGHSVKQRLQTAENYEAWAVSILSNPGLAWPVTLSTARYNTRTPCWQQQPGEFALEGGARAVSIVHRSENVA